MSKAVVAVVLYRIPCVLICLIVLLSLWSWVGSVYGMGMENLLCADGIRWAVVNVVPNFVSVPTAEVLLLMMGLSVIIESGLPTACFFVSSLKQKRALLFTLTLLFVFCLLVLALVAWPGAVLLNAFGTLHNSPFSKSVPGLLFVLALIAGNGYGYTSGRFVTMRDIVAAHTRLISLSSGYFVMLFVASQFIACARYTHVFAAWGDETCVLDVLSWILYYGMLVPYIWVEYGERR